MAATYMPLESANKKVRVVTTPTGFRKIIRLPRIEHIPYFSGTLVEFDLEVHNDSEECEEIDYEGSLFRLSGITHKPADHIKQSEGSLKIHSKSKAKHRICLTHLPQPGNYFFRLEIKTKKNAGEKISGDTVYFDALPKGASSFNVWVAISAGIIGGIIGALIS